MDTTKFPPIDRLCHDVLMDYEAELDRLVKLEPKTEGYFGPARVRWDECYRALGQAYDSADLAYCLAIGMGTEKDGAA